MLKILSIRPRSPAHKAGLRAGDYLLRINGQSPPDFLSYMASSGLPRKMEFKTEGRLRKVHDSGLEDFGIVLEGFREKRCRNRCVFCFIDQLPKGLRPSMYVKDDDYRLSFLYGNYVSLSGETQESLRRIELLHLSPLYISVHCTDPHVRGRLLGLDRPAPILPVIERLTRKGIQVHCQIVVCAGYNDGPVLDRTLDDLSSLFPAVSSVSITPVGLTRYRDQLPRLAKPDRRECRRIVDLALDRSTGLRSKFGRSMIYPTDEMFIQAGRPVPGYDYYDDFSQIENGSGLFRLLERDFHRFADRFGRRGAPKQKAANQVWITGRSAAGFLRKIAEAFANLTDTRILVVPIENRFFGRSVTVSGLLCGADLIRAARPYSDARIILPPNCLNHDGLTLDGLSLQNIRKSALNERIEIFSGFRSLVSSKSPKGHCRAWIPSFR